MPGYLLQMRMVVKSGKFFFCKVLYILSLLLIYNCVAYSQRIKIESLKTKLDALQDSARIDCLNDLSLAYTYLQLDSATFYAEEAFSESSRINYQSGLITSMNNKARIAGLGFRDFPLQEKICLQTIQLDKNESNKKALAETYMNLALAYFCQSYFDSATDACNKVIQLSQFTGNKKARGEATAVLGSISFESGNYEKSFDYFNQSLAIFKSAKDSFNTAIVLAKIGDLYHLAGDSKTALNFYSQSLAYPQGSTLVWHPLVDLGDTYYSLEQFDSSLYDQEKYLQTIKYMTIRSNYTTLPRILMAEKYISSKEYKQALSLLAAELKLSKKNNDKNQIMRLLLDVGKAYEGEKSYKNAITYTRDLLQNAKSHNAKQYIRDGYKLMSALYDAMHHLDSAYYYYREYTRMKEYVAVDDFTKKLAIYRAATENEKKRAQIELLNNEKVINQQQLLISNQRLKSTSILKNILIISVFVLALLGFIIFRNVTLKRKNEANRHEIIEKELTLQKLESERAKSEMQQKAGELEMQALRAQMNPHFIFNCLNSINRFIIANDATKAADHLTKFAKLIRIVLEQSGKSFITLEDELYCLQLYMDLEKLRFEVPFQYEINTDEIDTSSVLIPSLLIQPFVENAIWHGLQGNKRIDNKICINMNRGNGILHCRIIDNGAGRLNKNVLGPKPTSGKKSLGIELTRTRLQLIDSSKRDDVGINIYDLKGELGENAGTCVEIKIPVKEI
jgi:Histidine kinase/Tetratricopeptide repeat